MGITKGYPISLRRLLLAFLTVSILIGLAINYFRPKWSNLGYFEIEGSGVKLNVHISQQFPKKIPGGEFKVKFTVESGGTETQTVPLRFGIASARVSDDGSLIIFTGAGGPAEEIELSYAYRKRKWVLVDKHFDYPKYRKRIKVEIQRLELEARKLKNAEQGFSPASR